MASYFSKRKAAHEKQYAIRKFAKSANGKYATDSRGLRRRPVKITIPRGPTGASFPLTMTADMIWARATNVAITTTIPYTFQFRANSVFDPLFGLSPDELSVYGLDQMAALYSKYTVKAITVDIKFTLTVDPAQAICSLCFITGTDSPPDDSTKIIGRSLPDTTQMISASTPYHIRKKYRLSDFNQVLDWQRESSVTGNPNVSENLAFQVSNISSGAVFGYVAVKLVYHTTFSTRKFVRPSVVPP